MKRVDPSKFYDDMAELYVQKNEKSVFNNNYERPATISLLPNVLNKNVLDAGCGGGALTEFLLNQGAKVTAVDVSRKLVSLTKERVGLKADVRMADLSKPLSFIRDNSIDVIVSSLVLHYIEDWGVIFSEFNRMLKNEGSVVFSVHHPHADWLWHDRENYFKKEILEETWTIQEKSFQISYYHRTLEEMFEVFVKAGFYVDKLLEPLPSPEIKTENPRDYFILSTKPRFLFFRLKKLSN
jgi:SAM-dependent methyltransferase